MNKLYIIFLLFCSCSPKFIQKSKKNTISPSPEGENNVLHITNEVQKYDIYNPLIWVGLIIALVMLLTFSSLIFKK
jgi:hypothetical protein